VVSADLGRPVFPGVHILTAADERASAVGGRLEVPGSPIPVSLKVGAANPGRTCCDSHGSGRRTLDRRFVREVPAARSVPVERDHRQPAWGSWPGL